MSDIVTECVVPGCTQQGQHVHTWLPAIDPGNEVSKLKPHSTDWIIALVRRHPEATLARGEAGLLVARIDELQAEVTKYQNMAWYHSGSPPSDVEEAGR